MYAVDLENSKAVMKGLADLCVQYDAHVLAGPITSGAVIAAATASHAIITHPHHSICPVFLRKPEYKRLQHNANNMYFFHYGIPRDSPIVIVDDVIDSGQTIKYAITNLRTLIIAPHIVVIATTGGFYPEGERQLRSEFPSVHLYHFSYHSMSMEEIHER